MIAVLVFDESEKKTITASWCHTLWLLQQTNFVIWHWGFFLCSTMHACVNNGATKTQKSQLLAHFEKKFKKQSLFKLVSKMFSFERQKTCEWFVWIIFCIWFDVHTHMLVLRMINMKHISVMFNAHDACANLIPPSSISLSIDFFWYKLCRMLDVRL